MSRWISYLELLLLILPLLMAFYVRESTVFPKLESLKIPQPSLLCP